MEQIELEILKEDFFQELYLSKRKIEILGTDRDKVISIQDVRTLSRKQEISDNLLILLLDYKAQKKREKGLDYNPIFLNSQKVQKFSNFLAALNPEQPFEFYIIIRLYVHYTPLRIVCDGVSLPKIFVIDSSPNNSNLPAIRLFQLALNAELYLHSEGIQFSQYGCAIFAIQNLNAKLEMSVEQLQIMLSKEEKDIFPLAGKFMRHVQSRTNYSSYLQKNPTAVASKKGTSFVEYVLEHSRRNNFEEGEAIGRNYSMNFKYYKYLKAIEPIIGDLSIEKFLKIKAKVTGENILNEYLFKSIEPFKTNLLSKYQLRLFTEFLIPEEAILAATCLYPFKGADKLVYDIVKDSYDKAIEQAKTLAAQEKFSEIKDLDFNQLRLLELGFDKAELMAAKCFSKDNDYLYQDMELSNLAYQIITDLSIGSMQKNFELIKDYSDIKQIIHITNAKNKSWVRKVVYDNTDNASQGVNLYAL